jgi:outer membrane protein OmpA-like peptidoglycan-associated protein/uncharacterized protein YidB (DUF937 family)
MFETLINQLAQQFGLGNKAAPLVSQVLGLMTQSSSGGLPGFLDQFTKAGLGSQVKSWVGSGENQPLPQNDLVKILGNPLLEKIANKAGLPLAAALPATAAAIPSITDALTPDGQIPAILPPGISRYLPAAAASLAGTAAVGAAQRPHWDNPRKAALGASLGGMALMGLLGGMLGGGTVPKQAVVPPDNPPPPVAALPSPDAPPAPAIANPFDDLVNTSKQKAKDALTALQPGAYGGEELTKALNLLIINFPTGSAEIPPEDKDILKQAAETMKALPSDTLLEVGGHTDSTGDAAANQILSQQRAESVVKALSEYGVDGKMLQPKGYGGDKSIASNDTEEGRFQNRRIEFVVIKPINP